MVASAFEVVGLLSKSSEGVCLGAISDSLSLPKSGVHRLLGQLMEIGLVRQGVESGRYFLTLKLLSLAFGHLTSLGVADAASPFLDQLASESGELVRLAIVEADRLVWIAKAQGSNSGLIYDPQMGAEVPLFCTASGLYAWLCHLFDREAVRLVLEQGIFLPPQAGPNAPASVVQLLDVLEQSRFLGYSLVQECSAPGMSAIACALKHPNSGSVLGIVSIGGPSIRLLREHLDDLIEPLMAAASSLDAICSTSPYLSSAHPNIMQRLNWFNTLRIRIFYGLQNQ
ncbi:IclR family transcriptional regulator [Acidithrix ferrooxidans]|uniref:IclR family transcriptional regulator n=1 Tax=Acidithrix ferrooxidans TaxID=1280514 RepID=UPI001364CCE4|nr:IclR family transcriptional regulator [Acidithrix ferrooxidans]